MNFNDIYKEYYQKIFNFCYAKLNDRQLSEDCTQEVFLAFSKKMHTLRLDTNVAAWLYTAAKMEIKRCKRKNKGEISIDEVDDIPQDKYEPQGIFDDILTDDELVTLTDYYVNGEDVKRMALERNISVSTFYQRIRRIKQKIIQNSDKFHKSMQ